MILNDKNVSILASMDSQIVLNTYNLITTAVPELKRESDSLFIVFGDTSEKITYFDECIFKTLCEFTYIPLWYIIDEMKSLDIYSDPKGKVKNWKNLGLVFIDQQTIGEFIRPTNYLYQILQLKKKKYESIPFNMLSHTMSKLDIYVKSMLGISNEVNDLFDEQFRDKENIDSLIFEPIDVLSVKTSDNNFVLNLLEGNKLPDFIINGNKRYLKVIDEKDIKIAKNNTAAISKIENQIISEIKSGNIYTSELKNSSFFYVAINEGDGYILQFPDLIIPIKRNSNGSPNSIAIEMELTCKNIENYKRNLKKYKNSLKFGSVIWFCGSNRIKKTITEAYKTIGGTGFTSTYLYDYVPPRRKEIDL